MTLGKLLTVSQIRFNNAILAGEKARSVLLEKALCRKLISFE